MDLGNLLYMKGNADLLTPKPNQLCISAYSSTPSV